MKTSTISLTLLLAILFSAPVFASSSISCAYKAKAGERVITRDVDTVQHGKPIKVQKCFLVKMQKPLPKSFTRGPVVHNKGFEKSHWNK